MLKSYYGMVKDLEYVYRMWLSHIHFSISEFWFISSQRSIPEPSIQSHVFAIHMFLKHVNHMKHEKVLHVFKTCNYTIENVLFTRNLKTCVQWSVWMEKMCELWKRVYTKTCETRKRVNWKRVILENVWIENMWIAKTYESRKRVTRDTHPSSLIPRVCALYPVTRNRIISIVIFFLIFFFWLICMVSIYWLS